MSTVCTFQVLHSPKLPSEDLAPRMVSGIIVGAQLTFVGCQTKY